MGIYIPNMEKPKNCRTCNFKSNKEGECWFVHDENDCPLIEMGDIEYQAYKQISTTLLKRIEERILYGERRADDNTIKADK